MQRDVAECTDVVVRGGQAKQTPGVVGSATRRRAMRVADIAANAFLPAAFLLVLIVAWQAVVVVVRPDPSVVPSPVAVVAALGGLWNGGVLAQAVVTSMGRGLLGFVLAVLIGTPIGLLLAEISLIRRTIAPLITGLQVLPSVAWVPAAILWFGVTEATEYFVILVGAIPSIVTGLLAGVDQVSPQLRRVGTVLGASRWQQAALVVLPAALPGYVAGLKQGWAFAWRALMSAEIISTSGVLGVGLGTLLDRSRRAEDIASVIVAILAILAVGIFVELMVFAPLQRGLARRRGLAAGAT